MWIERYQPRWHSDVIRLANTVFGEGYFSRPWESATDPGPVMLVSYGDGPKLLGFVQGTVLPQGSLRQNLENRVSDIPADIEDADAKGCLGAIQAVAVAPDARRQGIGSGLLRAMHDALVGQGADKLIVTFKKGPTAPEVDRMMQKLGFAPWTRLPSYWQPRCDAGEFKCVDRQERCTCEALFYRKAIY
jgi:GNAT superfamily N-acetyltransferase